MMAHSKLVFRILTEEEWHLETENLPLRPVDEESGFLHLSSADQLAGTAAKHFSGERLLYCLGYSEEALSTHLKWEIAPSRGEAFPHYYAPLARATACFRGTLVNGPKGWVLKEI